MAVDTTGKKVLATIGGVIGTGLILWPLATWLQIRKLEKPKYSTLLTLGSLKRAFYDRGPYLEIREYQPYVVAEVNVEVDDMRKANSEGFKLVANYIFGNNTKENKIEMTSPVLTEIKDGKDQNGEKGEKIAMTTPVQTEVSKRGYKISFVMPSAYSSSKDLPKPNNDKVQLKDVPAQTLAALSWRGYPKPSKDVVDAKEAELRAALADAGIKVASGADTRLFQYYPPFAPQPIRLQEVLLAVEKSSLQSKLEKNKSS